MILNTPTIYLCKFLARFVSLVRVKLQKHQFPTPGPIAT